MRVNRLDLAAVLLEFPPVTGKAAEPPPNMSLIMADDPGIGHLGCYGQTKIQMPNTDRMAAEGMEFTQFYSSAAVCAPARSVLMTGLPISHIPIGATALTAT